MNRQPTRKVLHILHFIQAASGISISLAFFLMRKLLLLLTLLVFTPLTGWAQLPLIRLDRITPLGGRAGGEVALDIAGRDLEDVKTLHFDHPGLKATWTADRKFKIALAADLPPGTYEVRAVGRFGISGARLFAVQHGLTEIAEKEPNNDAAAAQVVPMNAAINGTSDNNGDDYFRFPAKKGERVTIECFAYRLDSQMTPMLSIAEAPRVVSKEKGETEGRLLMQSRPYHHRTDPFLDFVAPADGDYLVRVHDMTFRGGLPYRLIVSSLPHIEQVYPMAVAAGAVTNLTLLGRNLPGGKPTSWKTHDETLEQFLFQFNPEVIKPRLDSFTFSRHMPSASLNARGMQLWPVKNALDPITLTFADAPVVLDKEPNDTSETAQAITLPAVLCGRFDKPGDADWYRFTAKKGESYAVDLLCERLELPGDPYVLVFDAKGNEVATFDDHGINSKALAQFNRDPVGVLKIPADGEYRIFLQERYQNGGARYQYVLRVTNLEPDFYPVLIHETPSEPSCPTVHRGGSAFFDLCLNRRNYAGPVVIEAEGLPKGVTCPPVHVSSQGQFATIVVSAATDAPEWEGAFRLKAHAIIDGRRVEREVRGVQRRYAVANINTSVMLRETCLAIRGTAPYAIRLPDKLLSASSGDMLETTAKLTRLWPEFKGKVQLIGLNLPPGFSFATSEFAADQTETPIKLNIAANVPAGDYTVVLRGDAQVPYTRDPKAVTRPNVRVADPSTGMIVRVTTKATKK